MPMEVDVDIEFKTLVYKKRNRDLKLDLYYPARMGDKNPLIYFAWGGWISGFRNQPNNVSWCRFLASRGFMVASIDYRYGLTNSMEDILRDYGDGLQFLRDRAEELKIDRDNIILMGLSAGGHLSLLYAAYNSFLELEDRIKGIRAVVAYYAPSNLKDIFDKGNKSLFAKFGTARTLDGKPTEIRRFTITTPPLIG